MSFHFSKHYTIEEARAMLPRVRQWFEELESNQGRLQSFERRISAVLKTGADAGGAAVNDMLKTLAVCKKILQQFQRHEIQIKDLNRGLIDFPSLRNGHEVFLCWEKDEEDIEYWHDLESGFGGREKI